MSQSKPPSNAGTPVAAQLALKGGAAIVAPVGAFPGGVPQNALVVLPLKAPTEELTEKLKQGPLVIKPEQMWELLGFNGPAVQVEDNEGRPLTIGLNDLIDGLDSHWKENPGDLNRGRIYAHELMKYGRPEQAEKVLAKIVAMGGTGDDWLGLGVAQIGAKQWDKAESTLKGAQNLLPNNPFPSLHLARVYQEKEEVENERTMVEKAISLDPKCVDAWAFLYGSVRKRDGEEAAVKAVTELAEATPNRNSAAPYVALQGLYSAQEGGQDKAMEFAKQAVTRDSDDVFALVSLSALYGQRGDLQAVISLLKDHENKMTRDVRLANNYFEALMQAREIEKVTKLLNALAGSSQREVKQFAIDRSRRVAQLLQQQQAQVRNAAQAAAKS